MGLKKQILLRFVVRIRVWVLERIAILDAMDGASKLEKWHLQQERGRRKSVNELCCLGFCHPDHRGWV